jgi:hypothetical protein
MALTQTEWEILTPVRTALSAAQHGEAAAIVARAAGVLGCSPQTVYRKLKDMGFDAGRKQRQDAGKSAMSLSELRLVAGVLMASQRDTGKTLLTVEDALEILQHSGQLRTKLSPSQVARLLEANNMHPKQLSRPEPSIRMRSLHPNHVWQLDSSVCVLYYLPSGQLKAMNADEFYRNKPGNIVKAVKDMVTRFAATDHYSGAFKVRYYLGGESAATTADFLTWAMWQQEGVPFHGAPLILMIDPGPGNSSNVIKQGLDRLQITPSIHKPGAARVNGQVENMHQLIERHFEGRLRFVDRAEIDLDSLNAMAQRWATAHNSNRIHSRHGEPRYSMWMRITQEQLRVPASLEAARDAFTKAPETRVVKNDLTITVGANWYNLRNVPGVAVGARVTVATNPFRHPALDVQVIDADTGEERWQVVEPDQRDEAGFSQDWPVIGAEHERRAPHSAQDTARGRLLQEAYREGANLPSQEDAAKARKAHQQAYAGLVDPMADVAATVVPAYMPRRSTEIAFAARTVEMPKLSTVEAAKRLKELMGEAYTPQVYTWLAQHHPEGVTEDQLSPIVTQFTAPAAADQAEPTTGLRLISGQR